VRPAKLAALGDALIGHRLLPGTSGRLPRSWTTTRANSGSRSHVSTEHTSNQEPAFRFAPEGKVNVFYWIDGKFAYALSASIDKDQLARVATASTPSSSAVETNASLQRAGPGGVYRLVLCPSPVLQGDVHDAQS